jgi:hypothetical protein
MNTSKFSDSYDINMGKRNGLRLKKLVSKDHQLRMKCVPFLFCSSSRATAAMEEAYSSNVQGYFEKPGSLAGFSNGFVPD